MTPEPPGTFRVTWLVTRLVLRRLVNRFSAFRRKKKPGTTRQAVAKKSPAGTVLLAFVSVLFVFQTTTVTTRLVHHLAREVEQREEPGVVFVGAGTFEALGVAASQGACLGERDDPELRSIVDGWLAGEIHGIREPELRERRLAELRAAFRERCLDAFRPSPLPAFAFFPNAEIWHHGADPLAMGKALALAAVLLTIAVMLQNVAGTGRDLVDVDHRFEWLFSFPVPARSLFLARILATAFTAPSAWVLLCPFFVTVFLCSGLGLAAYALGIAVTLYAGFLSGSLRTLLETALPRLLSPANVGRVQAALMLVAYATLFSAFGVAYSPDAGVYLARALALSDSWLYLPVSASLALTGTRATFIAGALVIVCSAVAVVALTVAVAERLVRDGVVVGARSFQGARGAVAPAPVTRSLFRGIAKKELRALFRDRQLRTQAFVTPVMLTAFQIWLNPSLLSSLGSSPRHVATAAFATAMFPLLTGAFSALATEGAAVYTLYAAPVPLERLLASKLSVWVGVAWGFALVVFVGLWSRTPSLVVSTLPYVPLVFAGILVYAVIALGVGALGSDPLETEPRKRVRVSSSYLFMILASLFGYALYTPSLWAKVVQLALSTLLAYALWQKLREHLPYVLDPTEAPPASIAVADGLLAALAFFVLQGLGVLLIHRDEGSLARDLLLAFVGAGALTALVAVWLFHRSRLPDLFRALGLRAPAGTGALHRLQSLGAGVALGLVAAGFGLVYQTLAARVPVLRELIEEAGRFSNTELSGSGRVWFFALAVFAAPVFEEFIFRGILYRGFRRSLRVLPGALASSAVFALVHPAVSALPVFVMALVACLLYERFRWLGAPVATHMTYNAVLVGVGLWSAR